MHLNKYVKNINFLKRGEILVLVPHIEHWRPCGHAGWTTIQTSKQQGESYILGVHHKIKTNIIWTGHHILFGHSVTQVLVFWGSIWLQVYNSFPISRNDDIIKPCDQPDDSIQLIINYIDVCHVRNMSVKYKESYIFLSPEIYFYI